MHDVARKPDYDCAHSEVGRALSPFVPAVTVIPFSSFYFSEMHLQNAPSKEKEIKKQIRPWTQFNSPQIPTGLALDRGVQTGDGDPQKGDSWRRSIERAPQKLSVKLTVESKKIQNHSTSSSSSSFFFPLCPVFP